MLDNNNFKCDKCNKSYKLERNYKNHKCNINIEYFCDKCNKSYKLERNYKNHKCEIVKSKKCIDSKDILLEYFDKTLLYVNDIKILDNKYGCLTRLNGLNENISENLIKFILRKNNINCDNSLVGDLIDYKNKQTYECKCYTSDGPISFGPKESWDKLCLLDGTDWLNKKFKLYLINLKNTDEPWKNIKINSNKTYEQTCKSKLRPHIAPDTLIKQIDKKYITLLFDGYINDI